MSKNPFELPEFRSRLALYVSVEDALSCIRVSKAFSQDFAYPIWHTIDFRVHKRLVNLNGAALRKYGHLIRVVSGVESQAHIDSLLYLKVGKLSTLKIKDAGDALFQASWNDLVRQNQKTLVHLRVTGSANVNPSSRPIVFLDCLTSTANSPHSSYLTKLNIQYLTLTRNSLISILRCCHNLVTISLWATTLIPSQNFDSYQHPRVSVLHAMISEVFTHGNPPLLVHFPNLVRWRTCDTSTPSKFPTRKVKSLISKSTPSLRAIETGSTPGPLLTHILGNVFIGISSLTFDYKQISSDLILTLLRHPAKWTSLVTYPPRDGFFAEFEKVGVSEIQDHFRGSGWMLQSLLRICPNLKTFNFQDHEMDMDEMEQVPWACKNLESLKVRINGLDTRKKIEGAIAKWRKRRIQKKAKTTMRDFADQDQSIEVRTARHLLQFDKLRTVWLGSKQWRL